MQHGVLKKLGLLFFLLVSCFANAQQDSLQRPKAINKSSFHAILNLGLLAGANGRDAALQVIPGISYRSWVAGIGGGLDYYFQRSMPFFIDVRKTFPKAHAFFLYADGGVNMPWIKSDKGNNSWYNSRFHNGGYFDGGAGWQVAVGRKQAVLLSAGYCVKKYEEMQKPRNVPPEIDERYYTTHLHYNFRRLSIKVGFQF